MQYQIKRNFRVHMDKRATNMSKRHYKILISSKHLINFFNNFDPIDPQFAENPRKIHQTQRKISPRLAGRG